MNLASNQATQTTSPTTHYNTPNFVETISSSTTTTSTRSNTTPQSINAKASTTTGIANSPQSIKAPKQIHQKAEVPIGNLVSHAAQHQLQDLTNKDFNKKRSFDSSLGKDEQALDKALNLRQSSATENLAVWDYTLNKKRNRDQKEDEKKEKKRKKKREEDRLIPV